MSTISIIKVHTISPEELNLYLAEFIRSFRLNEREDYEPLGLTRLVSSIERYFFIFLPAVIMLHYFYREGKFIWLLSFMIDLETIVCLTIKCQKEEFTLLMNMYTI